MLQFIETATQVSSRVGRRKLWDINPGWHCSIVGTCLSLGELRILARKVGYLITDPEPQDFQLHSTFVQKSATRNRTSKLIQKLLDHKHGGAIRRFRKAGNAEELMKVWNEAYLAGDVPGPYWAVMSHPLLDENNGVRIYGDVHMLSHLVGASNRADISSLNRLEQKIAEDQEQASRDSRRQNRRLSERADEISSLKTEILELKEALSRSGKVRVVAEKVSEQVVVRPSEANLELERLHRACGSLEGERDRLLQENKRLSTTISQLDSELTSLENALSDTMKGNRNIREDMDLEGCRILYVGGRIPEVSRLRDLVRQWNGELLHHDGGVEKSLKELNRFVAKADAVLFPTDCISHNAALRVKHLCHQSLKPYVPLRTSGLASFVAGLRLGLAGGPLDP